MKILHTADWHIGKKLHKHDLGRDFELFTDWLTGVVRDEQIDVLIVSGDIFDQANPSSEARTAYFQTLVKLSQLNCKTILTGGNHDSPSVLNAPRELLKYLDIHVIGSLPNDLQDCLIPLQNAEGKTEAVVAAIPYLRDPDLRQATEDFSYENRMEAIREGIERVFKNAAEQCRALYPDVPAIAMGHLYAAGVTTSESERDIQIGNQASFEAGRFGDYFRYIALGHIHKPQTVSGSVPVYYSGSPIPLSFSEREDQKRVLLIDTGDFSVENMDVPSFRTLKRLAGTLAELEQKLNAFEPKGGLVNLLELEMIEENYDPAKILELDTLVVEFAKEGAQIVKHRATFQNQVRGTAELFDPSQQLEDLKPMDVFEKRLAREDYDEETKALVTEAFRELLDEVQNGDSQ